MFREALTKDTMDIIAPDGTRQTGVRGLVEPKLIIIPDKNIDVAPGFLIEAKLPNGRTSTYRVEDVQFFPEDPGSTPDFYELTVKQAQRAAPAPHAGSVVYNVSGPNARINVSSTDSSINVAQVNSADLFGKLLETAQQLTVPVRDDVIGSIEAMQSAADGKSFMGGYTRFISLISDHLTVFGPFIPALAQLIQRFAT